MTALTKAVIVTGWMLGGVASSAPVAAQTAPRPPATFERVSVTTWKNLHDRILAIAKDREFPDDKLEWRPHPDSRSVLDELRHVTIGLESLTARIQGVPFDQAAREKADAAKPRTRASVVADMEAAIAASYPAVERQPVPAVVGWLEHQGEHYGKLITAYRVNGVVPPVSRPR